MRLDLIPHPDTPSHAALAIMVDVERRGPGLLALRYRLSGNLEGVKMPAAAPAKRADELWRHSCFEAFIRAGNVYYELNFAPSTLWAAYRFDGYRSGMSPAPGVAVRRIAAAGPELTVEVEGLPEGAWTLGLSAVIEETDGCISYWSLAHPPGKPDFHHPDCFVFELPPPV
jgi:hypothetical protein